NQSGESTIPRMLHAWITFRPNCCACHDLLRFGSRIEPKLVATSCRDLWQDLLHQRRRQINTNLFGPHGHVANTAKRRQSFHLSFLGVHRKNCITLTQKRSHSLVSERCSIIGSPNDSHSFHGPCLFCNWLTNSFN